MAYRIEGSVERRRTVHLEASSRRIERLVTNLSNLSPFRKFGRVPRSLCPLALFQRPSDSADYGTTFERCHDLVCFVSAETGNDTDDFWA